MKSQGLDEETDSGSAAGTVAPQMETSRSRLQRTVRAKGEDGEDPFLLGRGVLRTAVMTGLSILQKKQQKVYNVWFNYLESLPTHLHRFFMKNTYEKYFC